MRIALVEPYYGGSHRAWADGYAANSSNDVTLVTHEARFWKWRMHGAHLTLAEQLPERLSDSPDVVLASSMMDVASFAGAARHVIGDAPIAVYFHESQFSYPLSPLDRPDLTYPMTNWSSAAVSDLAIFNSEFHRSLFFDEADRFLRQFPDRRHGHLVAQVHDRSTVLPVGVDLQRIVPPHERDTGEPALILWNQRWEHDKRPDEFVRMIEALAATDLDFEVAVVGEQFVSAPEAFDRLPGILGGRLAAFGFLPDDDYVDVLQRADIVVSTAEHEFFGIAVVEAMAAGAFPVLPDRLVYPERIPDSHHERCLYEDFDGLVKSVRWAVEHRTAAAAVGEDLAASVQRFDWTTVAPEYDKVLESLATRAD